MRSGLMSIAGGLWLGACGGATVAWEPLICEEPSAATHGFFGTLYGEGDADGSFSADPPGDRIVDRTGAYDAGRGTLRWVDTYADGDRLDEVRWEGEGVVFANGDLDLELVRTTVGADGVESERTVRILRVGCNVERTEREDGEVVWFENATYKGDTYDFRVDRLQASAIAEGEGEASPDGSLALDETWRIGDVEHRWSRRIDVEGEEEASFEVRNADRFADGAVEVRVGGSTDWDYTVSDADRRSATWQMTLGPAGNGSGLVTLAGAFEDVECDVQIEGDTCTVDEACTEAPRAPCWRVVLDGVDRSSRCCTP